jgi:hypothetical protein
LDDVFVVSAEVGPLTGVAAAFAELEGVVLLGCPVIDLCFMEEGEGEIVLTLAAQEKPVRESGFAYEIGEEFVGFDFGIECIPVVEVGFQGFFGFAGDERLARGHPVGGGV